MASPHYLSNSIQNRHQYVTRQWSNCLQSGGDSSDQYQLLQMYCWMWNKFL